jgi:hypothetical protein
MGFRLPIVGYVGPRSTGVNLNPNGQMNQADLEVIRNLERRVIEAYNAPNGPSKQFSRGDGVNPNLVSLGVYMEWGENRRPMLSRLLHWLSQGGTIITPDLIHVSRTGDGSRSLMRTHLHMMVGFLFTDIRHDYHLGTSYGIDEANLDLMKNRRRVDSSLEQKNRRRV